MDDLFRTLQDLKRLICDLQVQKGGLNASRQLGHHPRQAGAFGKPIGDMPLSKSERPI
jgi:hypothetical protein